MSCPETFYVGHAIVCTSTLFKTCVRLSMKNRIKNEQTMTIPFFASKADALDKTAKLKSEYLQ